MLNVSKQDIINKIKTISVKDIADFAYKYNIFLSRNELEFVYSFIKNNYLDILNNPKSFNLNLYKEKFSEENFIKLNKLYNKYSSYLNLITLTN